MSGEVNLAKVLNSLNISCDNIEYGFASLRDDSVSFGDQIIATFKEEEGTTIIAPINYLQEKNIKYEGPYAKLTINVYTSLSLVGLTAVLASELAKNQISANVVAGFYHDHIFVQYGLKDKAIKSLTTLKD